MTRVIIGTAAVSDPDFVREAARLFPGRIAVGIDARDGRVAIEGWAKTSDLSALDLARRFEDAGVAAIIYTDISRDGALAGAQHRRARSRSPTRSTIPVDRVGRPCLDRGRQAADRARLRQARRRDRRPRAL